MSFENDSVIGVSLIPLVRSFKIFFVASCKAVTNRDMFNKFNLFDTFGRSMSKTKRLHRLDLEIRKTDGNIKGCQNHQTIIF